MNSNNESGSEPDVDLDIPEEEQDMSEWWTWGNFARLFIVPLVIVIVAVFVYGFFQFMVRDDRAVSDYIQQIEQGTERGRWRAAFDLAQRVRSGGIDKELTLTDVRQISNLYREADDPRVRMYLARVLGHVPTPQARNQLLAGLNDPDAGVRTNTLVALGEMNATEQAPAIADLLSDTKPQVRRMSAYVLGSLGNPGVTDRLRKALDDPEPDVRWNVAIALARLGDDAGEPVLRDILTSALEGDFKQMDPGVRSNLLVNTLKALENIDSSGFQELLKKLHKEDPSPQVREQALSLVEDNDASET